MSQREPYFLQRGAPNNEPIFSAKSRKLQYPKSICTACNDSLTQPYDMDWDELLDYLRAKWPLIVKRGWFDMSVPFPGRVREAALHVHLFFVKQLGCKLHDAANFVDLDPFSRALLAGTAHPELFLTVSNDETGLDVVVIRDTEIHARNDQRGCIAAAVWLYSVETTGVLVHYTRADVRLNVAGHAWHPSTARKIVRLSPPVGTIHKLPRSRVPVTQI